MSDYEKFLASMANAKPMGSAASTQGEISDDAPPWETDTWVTDEMLNDLSPAEYFPPGVGTIDGARASLDAGMISQTEFEYAKSAMTPDDAKDPDDPRKDLQRTRLERVLGYHSHRGKMMNAIGTMETLSGYRFFVASSAAVLEGLKGDGGLQVGGFGVAFSTEEFSKAWHGRTMYSDILHKGGADPNSLTTMAIGIAGDILLDPSTWLTFGVGAGTKVTVTGASRASTALSRSALKRSGAKAAEGAHRGGQFTLTRHGEDIMKVASREYMEKNIKEIYKRAGVKNLDNIQPEHIGGLLDDAGMRSGLADFALENYERFGLQLVDLQRKSGSILNPVNVGRKAVGGWSPRALSARNSLTQGPSSMFQETAGLLAKEQMVGVLGGTVGASVYGGVAGAAIGGFAGGPVGAVLGAATLTTVGTAMSPAMRSGDITGSILKSIGDAKWAQQERLSRNLVPIGLRTATHVSAYTGGMAYGFIEKSRNIFTSAMERLPGEERFLAQEIVDKTTNEMGHRAYQIRAKFAEKVERRMVDGSFKREKLTDSERQLVSHHLEDPLKHPVPNWMKPTVDWVKDQFDDIYELEKEWMIGGDKIEDYVTHLYSSSMFNKIMTFLKGETWSPQKLDIQAQRQASKNKNVHALHRSIASLDDAIVQFGADHVELDVARILQARWNVSARMRGKKALTFHLWDRYGIGGMAESLIIEQAGFKKLLRSVKYYRDNVDLGPPIPAAKSQHDTLDFLAGEVAKHDINLLGRRAREYMKDGELRYGKTKGVKRPVPTRGEGSELTQVVKGEDGKLIQRTDQLPRPENVQGPLKSREWFQPLPGSPSPAKIKEARKAGTEKRISEATDNNRKLLKQLAKSGLGVDWKKMSAGEADFLIDFLKAHVMPEAVYNVRTGKFAPRGWFGADGMTMVSMQHGKFRRSGSFFDEVEVEARAAESEARAWGNDKGAWGSKVGVSWEALDAVNVVDAAERASRATARASRGTTDEITRKLRKSERAVRESKTGKRPAARKHTAYEQKIAARKGDEMGKAAALEKAIEVVNLAGGMREVAEWLSRNVESESLGLVLKRISKYLDDSKLASPEVIGGHSGRRGQVAYKSQIDSLNPEAELVTSLQSTQRGLVWPYVAPPRVGGYTAEVVTHELVHVATMKQLDKGKLDFTNKTKSPMASAYNDLEELRKLVVDRKASQAAPSGEELLYAVRNVHELVAMALTNPKAQKELDAIIIDGESLWSKFTSHLVRLLTGRESVKVKTALTEAVRLADETIGLKKSEAFLEPGKKAARAEEARIQELWGVRTKAERALVSLEQKLKVKEEMVRIHGPGSTVGKNNANEAKAIRVSIGREQRQIDRLKWLDNRQPLGAAPASKPKTRLVPIGDSVYNIDPSTAPRVARDVLKNRHKEAKRALANLEKNADGTFKDPEKAMELISTVDRNAPKGARNRYTNRQVQEVIEDTIGDRVKRIKPYRHFESEREVLTKRIKDARVEAQRLKNSADEIIAQNPSAKGASKKAYDLSKKIDKAQTGIAKVAEKTAAIRKTHAERAKSLEAKSTKETELLTKAEDAVEASIVKRAELNKSIEDLTVELAAKKQAGKATKLIEKKLASKKKQLETAITKEADKLGPRVEAMSKRVEAANKKAIDFETITQKQFSALNNSHVKLSKDLTSYRRDIAAVTPKADIEEVAKAKQKEARGINADRRALEKTLAIREGRYSDGLLDLDGNYLMPRSMVDSIEQVLSSGFDMSKPLHRHIKAYQGFQKIWKIPLTLPFMKYWGRNLITSVGLTVNAIGLELLNPHNAKVAMNVVGHLLFRQQEMAFSALAKGAPKEVRKAWGKNLGQTKKGWTDEVITTKDGRKLSIQEITDQAISRGINQSFVYSEIMHEPFRRLDQTAQGWLIGAPAAIIKNAAMKTAMYGETLTDVPFRVAVFTQEVVNGKSYAEAAESVKKYLNDYSRLSPFEKRWMRTFMPFYSWWQFSLENAFKLAYEKPGQFLAPFKAAREISSAMTNNAPPDYAPNWINDRLGIWAGPNETGYYTRIQGFAVNQEEAMRQMFAMKDMANKFLFEATKGMSKVPIVGGVSDRIFNPGSDIEAVEEAPLRFLAQLDFGLKFVAEGWRGKDFFSDAPITPEMVSLYEGSRLESGRGFNRADDPEGVLENVVTVGGLGGKWLKSFLEYSEKADGGVRTAKVDPLKRWIVGSSPVSRFVSTYEHRIKHKDIGEVNYLQEAASALGVNVYRYNPKEGRYYRDKKRIKGLSMIFQVSHRIEKKEIYWERDIEGHDDEILAPLEELRKQLDEERK